MKWLWIGGGVALLAIAAACFFLLVPPPQQLDTVDKLWPGGRGGERVARDIAFGAHPRLKLDVYRAGPAGAPKPVLVFFHGGGWHSGDKDGYGFAGRAFADEGFVTIVPNYRLVPGVRFPVFVQDSAAAIAWAARNAARYGGDPARIVTIGHSAGAYNAVMPALDRRWLAAERLPPGTIKAAAGIAGPYDFFPFDKKSSQNAMAAWPRPQETQPINFVRADAPPIWLGHGTADSVVRPYNSVNLAAALRKAGARVVHREYPGASHNLPMMAVSRVFRDRLPTLAEASAFLKSASAPRRPGAAKRS